MQQNFLVSIILPTYNRTQYVKRAIESVLDQTYKNIELIIINDGSTDKTSEIISEFRKKDKRVSILTNKINLGFVKSLNNGITIARGKYIARIDDDDFWSDPKKLEKQIEFLENHPDYVLTGGGAIGINEKGKEIFRYLLPEKDENIRKYILSDNCFIHSTVVFRRTIWELVGGYDEKFCFSEDWDLWLKFGKFGKFYNFQEYFVYYLRWPQNSLNFNIKRNLRNRIELCKKYCKDYPGYRKAFFLSWVYYFSFFLPCRKKLRPTLMQLRTLISGRPPYK